MNLGLLYSRIREDEKLLLEHKGLDRAVPEVDDPARIVDWIEARAGEVAA